MPRDELGLDPYQRAAIRCARQGVCACCLCLLGACLVFAHRYAKPGSNEWVTSTAVSAATSDHLFYFGCFAVACAALICLMVRNKLVVEVSDTGEPRGGVAEPSTAHRGCAGIICARPATQRVENI